MRIFVFILAVIILGLSCIPCKDGAYGIATNPAKIENSKSKVWQEQQHKNDNDACSPFCTCNCCASFAFAFSSIKMHPIVHVAAKKYFSYLSSSAIAISLPVWQPPQL